MQRAASARCRLGNAIRPSSLMRKRSPLNYSSGTSKQSSEDSYLKGEIPE
uniref:Uncharacterized protein n=1 Tax=Anguilla anguilla TaxID=7936 RepID=A0A0E9QPG0_ANGAN